MRIVNIAEAMEMFSVQDSTVFGASTSHNNTHSIYIQERNRMPLFHVKQVIKRKKKRELNTH